jgi:hypothetical protein
MKRPTQRPALDRLHQHTQTKRTTHPPTLSEPAHAQPVERTDDYPVGNFGPKHGLTPAQAWDAQQLLNRANRLRPLRGPGAQARAALRKAGIIAAVKQGRVGNRTWGRRMHGKRGGKVMARQGLHHLRAIARRGSQAAAAKRQEKKALQDTAQRGIWEVLPQTGVHGPDGHE